VATVKTIRPNEEIRLRKWPPGRVSQLKIVVSNLEQAVNRSLAGQVNQSLKRRFSEFVPVIPFQDISGEVEFRELRVQFEPPKGLKNLLFYEFQISRTSGFFQFETFESPDPSFVFGGLEDNTTYFIRIRVVTTDGLVGPFSDNLTATTPTAKAAGALDTEEFTATVSSSSFTNIWSKTFSSLGGKLYYSIQYSILPSSLPSANNFSYSTTEFRWFELQSDFGASRQVGQNFQVTNYAYGGGTGPDSLSIYDGEVATAGNPLETTTAFRTRKRGTFVQKFHSTAGGSIQVSLQGRIVNFHTLPNEFQFNAGTSISTFTASSSIALKNFTRFEVFTQG